MAIQHKWENDFPLDLQTGAEANDEVGLAGRLCCLPPLVGGPEAALLPKVDDAVVEAAAALDARSPRFVPTLRRALCDVKQPQVLFVRLAVLADLSEIKTGNKWIIYLFIGLY